MHTIRQLARRALIATLIVTGALCGVVSATGALLGVLPLHAIPSNATTTAGEMMQTASVVAKENEVLHDVIARMAVDNVDRCPVVTADGSNRVVGFISPADLVRAVRACGRRG